MGLEGWLAGVEGGEGVLAWEGEGGFWEWF